MSGKESVYTAGAGGLFGAALRGGGWAMLLLPGVLLVLSVLMKRKYLPVGLMQEYLIAKQTVETILNIDKKKEQKKEEKKPLR